MDMWVVCVPERGAMCGPDAPATDALRYKHPARSTALQSSYPITFYFNFMIVVLYNCTHIPADESLWSDDLRKVACGSHEKNRSFTGLLDTNLEGLQ